MLRKIVADTTPPSLLQQLEQDLQGKLTHITDDRQIIIAQMIEYSVPTPEDIVGVALSSKKLVERMESVLKTRARSNLTQAEFADLQNLTLFRNCVTPMIDRLLVAPDFLEKLAPEIARRELEQLEAIGAEQKHPTAKLGGLESVQAEIRASLAEQRALLAEILKQAGGAEAALARPQELPLEELQALSEAFGGEPDRSREELFEFVGRKAEEYWLFRDQIDAIDDRVAGLGNLKAAAQDAAAQLDFEKVEACLARVDDVQTEIAAETKEARARNALLRGRVEEASRHLCAAADSFAGRDALEPARRVFFNYEQLLEDHWRRYGGDAPVWARNMI